MAGPNTTGLPRTSDYNLGRGVVYFAAIDAASGKPLGYRDLGNAPEFNISIESETLDHQSSRQGLKVTDKSVVISQTVSLALSLDEINHENLALLLSGSQATHTNPAKTGVTEYEWIVGNESSATNLVAGRWYDLISAAGERLYDVTAGTVVLKTTAGSPVTLAINTDYTVDATWGRVFIKASSAVNTAIAAFQGLTLTYAATAGSRNVDEVRGVTSTNIQGALKFISENPADNDQQTEFQFHQVSLKAEGDFSLIGDEFTVMNFTGVAEANALADPDSPTVTIRNIKPA